VQARRHLDASSRSPHTLLKPSRVTGWSSRLAPFSFQANTVRRIVWGHVSGDLISWIKVLIFGESLFRCASASRNPLSEDLKKPGAGLPAADQRHFRTSSAPMDNHDQTRPPKTRSRADGPGNQQILDHRWSAGIQGPSPGSTGFGRASSLPPHHRRIDPVRSYISAKPISSPLLRRLHSRNRDRYPALSDIVSAADVVKDATMSHSTTETRWPRRACRAIRRLAARAGQPAVQRGGDIRQLAGTLRPPPVAGRRLVS